MKTVKVIGNQEYIITTLEQNGKVQLYMNGDLLETVYYNAARNIYFAPYKIENEKYWITLINGRIRMELTKGELTEKTFLRDFPEKAYSTLIEYLYIIFVIAIPCFLMGIFTDISVVLLGALVFFNSAIVMMSNKASYVSRIDRITTLIGPPIIIAIIYFALT